jgi:hypothetical protein
VGLEAQILKQGDLVTRWAEEERKADRTVTASVIV